MRVNLHSRRGHSSPANAPNESRPRPARGISTTAVMTGATVRSTASNAIPARPPTAQRVPKAHSRHAVTLTPAPVAPLTQVAGVMTIRSGTLGNMTTAATARLIASNVTRVRRPTASGLRKDHSIHAKTLTGVPLATPTLAVAVILIRSATHVISAVAVTTVVISRSTASNATPASQTTARRAPKAHSRHVVTKAAAPVAATTRVPHVMIIASGTHGTSTTVATTAAPAMTTAPRPRAPRPTWSIASSAQKARRLTSAPPRQNARK